jgi:hypothetical protein
MSMFIRGLAAVLIVVPFSLAQTGDSADFEYFKNHVQPVFAKKREGHGRCIVCHTNGAPGGFGLEPLAPGSATWTDEQSRKNYETALRLIAPGDPTASILVMHPLSATAGGDIFHGGGRQFESRDDPDWRAIAAWVQQAKAPVYTNLKLIAPADLGRTMLSFDRALGVDCNVCHARDFAADTIPQKETARRMIAMTRQINATAPGVTCFSCHHEQTIPRSSPDPVPADF